MRTIWKFPLSVSDKQVIAMPKGANILTVQSQNGVGCIWAEVSPRADIKRRTFLTVGTGHDVPRDARKYVGTYQSGPFVWHVYEAT